MGEGQVGGIDADADFLGRLADRAVNNGFAVFQVPGRRAQLAVGVAGAGAPQQEDHPIGPLQQDVDIHDAAVAARRPGLRCHARLARRVGGMTACHAGQPSTARHAGPHGTADQGS
jgi:hypothetical protein